MIGPGHINPHASICKVSTLASASEDGTSAFVRCDFIICDSFDVQSVVAVIHVFTPPERLYTSVNPCCINTLHAVYPRKPTAQVNTIRLSCGNSCKWSRKLSKGMFNEPGIDSNAYSSAVRTSRTNIS